MVVAPARQAHRGGDVALLDESNVLDEQAEHAFALALRRIRVPPDDREVGGQGEDALTLVVVHGEPIGIALALVILLGHPQGTQFRVPVGLERIGDESIRRIDLHVAVPRLVGLDLRTLDLAVPRAISLLDPSRDLFLHGKRQLEGHRRDRLDEQLAHGGIDVGADDALAHRVAQALAAAEAQVVGSELAAAAVAVVHVHPAAAQPAQHTALQQGRAFSRRVAPLPAGGLRALLQTLLDALVLLPRDVSGVGVLDERRPLALGQALAPNAPIGLLAPAAPTIDVPD